MLRRLMYLATLMSLFYVAPAFGRRALYVPQGVLSFEGTNLSKTQKIELDDPQGSKHALLFERPGWLDKKSKKVLKWIKQKQKQGAKSFRLSVLCNTVPQAYGRSKVYYMDEDGKLNCKILKADVHQPKPSFAGFGSPY